MSDYTKIKTINEAKAAQYNGQVITDAEVLKIFESPLISQGGTKNKADLQATCTLLDDVETAKKKTTADSALLVKLQAAKTANNVAYKVVNEIKIGTNGKVDDAIAYLTTLANSPVPTPQSITQLQDSLKLHETSI